MHPMDAHERAVQSANADTTARFGKSGPFDPKSPEHDFWIERFDRHFARFVINPNH
jgi:hypothetical protein